MTKGGWWGVEGGDKSRTELNIYHYFTNCLNQDFKINRIKLIDQRLK